jgi:hypothetical protein
MAKRGRRLRGKADFRDGMNRLAREALNGTCLVDGVPVTLAFFIDTEAGVVRTYDLSGFPGMPDHLMDGKIHAACELSPNLIEELYPDEDLSGGVLSRTLYGRVDLFASADAREADIH